MAYIINRFNGDQLTVVEDGVLDTTTSIGLLGRNYTGYGEVQNENLVFLLEHFAGTNPPARAISGQVWYDTTGKALKVFNGTAWLSIGNATVADAEPAHSVGGLWLKTATQQMFISDGTTWRLIGPEGVEGFNVTKQTSTSLLDTIGTQHPVILTQIDGVTTGIFSADEFEINAAAAIPGFSTIKKGYNVKSTLVISGNLAGNADTATALQTARAINNVNFDGTENITIKATTTNPLKAGDYIKGSNWDGTNADTWGVNATPENKVGSVVARDSNGGFAAGPISADLVGNVTGNVTAYQGQSTFVRVVAPTIVGDTFTGNAGSASKLSVPRKINTVYFDGTEDITLPVPADTLTGTELASNVVTSSLRSLGKLTSLEVEAPGIKIGDGNNVNIYLEGFTPTIESDTTNVLKLKLASGSATTGPTGISFISAATSQMSGGYLAPALVPDYIESIDISQRASLGLPSYKWGRIYTEDTNTTNLNVTSVIGNSGAVVFPTGINATGGLAGNLVGNSSGTHTGNVIGNVTGAASANLLKSGDIMSGDINWSTTGRGISWGMNTDGASIRFYNTGDADTNSRLEFNTNDNGNEYFRWTHTINGSTFESMRLTPNSYGSADLNLTGNANFNGNVTLLSTNNTFQGRGSGITDINAGNLSTGTVPVARLSGTYNIGISGNAATATTASSATSNVYRAGDTLTGRLGQSVYGFHAVNIDDISTRTNSGFFDNPTPTTAKGWPVTGSWHHLLSSTHVNDANYYAMQFSADFYAQNLYYRSTNGNGSTAWNKILHSNNYNDYAPSKTGNGATGTWAINISGSAASVTNGVLTTGTYSNPAWITSLAGGKIGGAVALATSLSGGTVSATDGSFSGLLNLSAGSSGGIKFPNDPAGGGGDTASITYEGIASDRTRLRFRVSNDGTGSIDDKAEFITPDNDGLLVNDNIVLNAANYNNYSPTKTGGGASGTWPINITGNAVTVSSITKKQVTDALGFTPTDAGATPNFLLNSGRVTAETNGTGEPANKLTLREVYSNGYPTSYGNVITLGGAGGGELLIGWSGSTGAHADNYVRSRRDTGNTWSPWAKIVTDQNFASVASGMSLGFQVTTGSVTMVSYHSHVNWFHWEATYGDVFPPAGKTMADLLGVIVSNKNTYFAGGVNGDDILSCWADIWSDRIRVHVGNSEQRAAGEANWLAIWRN